MSLILLRFSKISLGLLIPFNKTTSPIPLNNQLLSLATLNLQTTIRYHPPKRKKLAHKEFTNRCQIKQHPSALPNISWLPNTKVLLNRASGFAGLSYVMSQLDLREVHRMNGEA